MTFTRDDRTLLGDDPDQGGPPNCRAGRGCDRDQLFWRTQPDPAHPETNAPGRPRGALFGHAQRRLAGTGRRAHHVSGRSRIISAIMPWPSGRAGACVIGGCCGTTPQHIAAMRKALDSAPAPERHQRLASAHDRVENRRAAANQLQPTILAQKLASGKFVIAVEMDPPRGLSTHKLLAGASLLAEAGADVINVADSPMARMRMSPWAVCSLIQRQVGIETVLHFPTRGRNLLRVQGDLLAAHALGVRNVFVVMGDPTAIGDYPDAMDNYDLVPSGLIKLIKQGFNAGVDHAGTDIGQPTSFFVGCALNLHPQDPQAEIKNLRRKLNAGADFILTQPIYAAEPVDRFLDLYETEYGTLSVPLLLGLLPLYNARHASFLHHEVPGVHIPEDILLRMEKAGENGPRTGVQIAIELTQSLHRRIQGIYLMPAFSRYDLVAEIIEAVNKP